LRQSLNAIGPIKNITGGAFVVGCFVHAEDPNTKAVMIMNYEVLYNLFATVEFNTPAGMQATEVSQTSGENVRIFFSDRGLPSRGVPLSFTPLLRLKRCHACVPMGNGMSCLSGCPVLTLLYCINRFHTLCMMSQH
jgi:hypothetical protein